MKHINKVSVMKAQTESACTPVVGGGITDLRACIKELLGKADEEV